MDTIDFTPRRDFFVGIDSDGCAFDTMELKHKNVFIPQAIQAFGFEAIADRYRSVAERVNLYSKTRGSNRFEAIAHCLDTLRDAEPLAVDIPDPQPIWEYVQSGRPLSNDSFAEYVQEIQDDLPVDQLDVVMRALNWSASSNRAIAELDVVVPPFPLVRESLEEAKTFANTMIVSATPAEALRKEWGQAGLLSSIDVIAGQEVGPKKQQIAAALQGGFAPERALLIGDAPGDHRAAQDNGILFFPIVPGKEKESWQQFHNEGLRNFRQERFAGAYQEHVVEVYYAALDAD